MALDAAKIDQNNAAFLMHSITRSVPMNTPDGTAYALGKKLRFTAPLVPGWLKKIRVFFDLTATVTLGDGTVAVSAAAPYNVIQNLKVLFGGQELRNTHPYFYRTLQQSMEHDGSAPDYAGPKTQSYSAGLFVTPAVAVGANSWKGYFDVPLQMHRANVLGLLPMGAGATPITLEMDCASAFLGTDPLLNPTYRLTGATSTVTVVGTMTAVAIYAYGQSPHDPRVGVPTPVIGSFAKMTQSETPIVSTAGLTFADLRDPYPLLKATQLVVVPSQAAFCTFANIVGARFDLDPSTPYHNYEATGAGISSLWFDQRDRYGQDLDVGVIVWDFISGSDPKHPDGMNSVNIDAYNAARAGVQYNGALAPASNRIVTSVMEIIQMPF